MLGKVVAVLEAFTMDDRGVTLAELGRRTGLAKGTLHRVCGDLVAAGLLERRDDRYRLGRLMFELGMRASVERDLLEVAGPFLEELRAAVDETVHLGVRDGIEVVYIAKLAGHRQMSVPSRTGGRLGLFCTAVGKALLAHAPAEVFEEVVRAGLPRHTPRTITAPGILRRPARAGQADGGGLRVRGVRTGPRLRGRAGPRSRRGGGRRRQRRRPGHPLQPAGARRSRAHHGARGISATLARR